MEDKEIKVSICCLTFNHEKYLAQTLDGFLNQKVDFGYEILIHDDASTDKTQEILKHYKELYPDKISLILQEKNQYSQGKKISWEYQFSVAKGKYIAMCEGDDYWTDEYKLQKQFDEMERHPECSVCTHRVAWINEQGDPVDREFPPEEMSVGRISIEEYLYSEAGKINWTFQTCSYFFRKKYVIEMWEEKPKFFMHSVVGDLPLMLYLVTRGDIYYISEVMGRYRCGSISSMTKTNLENNKKIAYYQNQIECMKFYNEYSKYKYNNYLWCYIRHYEFEILRVQKDYKKMCEKEYRMELNKFGFIRKGYYLILSRYPQCAILGNVYNKVKEKVNNGKKAEY